MNLEYRVLGPIEVWDGERRLDVGGARQRRLLGALILAGGRPVSADRLVDVVWVGDPPGQARNTLRTYIARARRATSILGPSSFGVRSPLHAVEQAVPVEFRLLARTAALNWAYGPCNADATVQPQRLVL